MVVVPGPGEHTRILSVPDKLSITATFHTHLPFYIFLVTVLKTWKLKMELAG